MVVINTQEIKAFMLRAKEKENVFYRENGERINELINVCKEHQGEYRHAHHGPGTWATTYSNEFINSSSQLYKLFYESGLFIPTHKLSECFIEADIRSCRGAIMNIDRVEYLYETHLKNKINQL